MKIEVIYESKIVIEFCDPEKARAYFIDGDWKDSFYTFDDLEEVADLLGSQLVDEGSWRWNFEINKWGCSSCEGFPEFQLNGKEITSFNDYGADHGEIKAQIISQIESDGRPIILEKVSC